MEFPGFLLLNGIFMTRNNIYAGTNTLKGKNIMQPNNVNRRPHSNSHIGNTAATIATHIVTQGKISTSMQNHAASAAAASTGVQGTSTTTGTPKQNRTNSAVTTAAAVAVAKKTPSVVTLTTTVAVTAAVATASATQIPPPQDSRENLSTSVTRAIALAAPAYKSGEIGATAVGTLARQLRITTVPDLAAFGNNVGITGPANWGKFAGAAGVNGRNNWKEFGDKVGIKTPYEWGQYWGEAGGGPEGWQAFGALLKIRTHPDGWRDFFSGMGIELDVVRSYHLNLLRFH